MLQVLFVVYRVAQDIVFAVTSVAYKPVTHLRLGLALKSITGRRKVIDLLNRLGAVSYSIAEEPEADLMFFHNSEQRHIP